jgi:pantoate--beta-alanine ligase
VHALGDLRAITAAARREGQTVGFVPTMGALHDGHVALVKVARERAGLVVVSIFVNPTQFGPAEDFQRYPRDLGRDLVACSEAGADVVYAPDVRDVYPEGFATQVRVTGPTTAGLCSPLRPGHFDGVATVVVKLLCRVGPCLAVFGRKDYQQLRVVERLVRDLDLEVEVLGVTTVREPDGLAMSSRNAYLSREERARAVGISRGLSAAWRLVDSAGQPVLASEVKRVAHARIDESVDAVDYLVVCDPDTLEPLTDDAPVGPRVLVAAAARIGATRLIDNVVIGEDPYPSP